MHCLLVILSWWLNVAIQLCVSTPAVKFLKENKAAADKTSYLESVGIPI